MKRTPTRVAACVAVLALPAAAQINTQNAGFDSTPDTPAFRERFRAYEAEHVFDVRLEHEFSFRLGSKDELGIMVPTVLHRRVDFRGMFDESHTETLAGLGDASLRWKHQLWQTDEVMSSNRWSMFAELTGPTGEYDDTSGGVDIPRMLQLGTGGWGMGGGTVYTWIRDRHRFSTELAYRHTSRHDGYRAGPNVEWNLAYWYRLTPAKFDPENERVEVRAVIELHNRYNFDSRIGDDSAGDHGLDCHVTPGIQVFPWKNLLFEASVWIPTLQTTNDDYGDRDWAFVFAVKLLF